MALVQITDTERNLIEKLKLQCDENGKEIDPKPSVPIFHKLAKIYGSKTKQKKLNAIRSVALYNAAIRRDPDNDQIKSDLRKFCSNVLVQAKAKLQNTNLVKTSTNLKRKLKIARKNDYYSNVTQIPHNIEGDRLVQKEILKIRNVQDIQKKITEQYKELMRFVSDECIAVMGKTPCKYSVVGLGSLARSEITLYSDFEHIILLEEEAAWKEERKTIMRYFKWFSTIFHVVLINLRETMIPTVAIPSLNGDSTNWFYDAHTKNGITFDGMASHASKIPLGRQPTVNKPWKMELIKPVKEMLQLLEKEEDIKQGYHLADILSKSCFVAGDENLFHEYQVESHKAIKGNDEKSNFLMVKKQWKEDLDNFDIINSQVRVLDGFENFNIKRVIYRSSTIFITLIGRLYSFKASSCFDIVDELVKGSICSETAAHNLRFMVAVACEVRSKVYHSKGEQDDVFMEDSDPKSVVSGLIKILGKTSLCSFMETVLSLQDVLNSALTATFPFNFSKMATDASKYNFKVIALSLLDLNEDLKSEMRELINFPDRIQNIRLTNYLFVIQELMKISEFSLCNDICQTLLSLRFKDKFYVRLFAFECKLELGLYDERNIQTEIEEMNKLILSYDFGEVLGLKGCILFRYSGCLLLANKDDQARNMLVKSCHYFTLFLQTPQARFEPPLVIAEFLQVLSVKLIKFNNFEKAFQSLQECLVLLKGYKQNTTMHKTTYNLLGVCYFNLKKNCESFFCFCEVVRIQNAKNELVDEELKQKVLDSFDTLLYEEFMEQEFNRITGKKIN